MVFFRAVFAHAVVPKFLWQPIFSGFSSFTHMKEAKEESPVLSDNEIRTVKTGVHALGWGQAQNYSDTRKAHHMVSE